jgi:O-antigen ligase
VLRAALLPGVGAAIAFAGLMPSIPASTSPRPGIAIAALLVGIGFVAAFSRAASAKTAVAAVLALGALAPAVADDLGTVLSSRFHVASPDRTAERAAALRLFREHPVTGTGPGEATLRWRSSDGEEVGARYAHNEYLQTLAELGVVGVGLLVALMFSLVRALNRTPRRLWAGVVAALLALGVQSVFDFLWHVPALPLVAALLAGAACPSVVENERDEHVDLVSDDLAVTHLDPLLLDPR